MYLNEQIYLISNNKVKTNPNNIIILCHIQH